MATQKSIFEELAPFAKMVIDQSRGVTVSDLAFASAEDRWSTCFIPLAALVYPANNTTKLFQSNLGEQGQGIAGVGGGALTHSIAETNNVSGTKMPANQVYIATHVGFQLYAVCGSLGVIPINNPQTLYQIASNTVWNLMVGDGIKRTLGTLLEYPAGCGIDGFVSIGASTATVSVGIANNGWVGAQKRKLPIPIVWPPNIVVDIEVQTGNAQTLLDNIGAGATAAILPSEVYTEGHIAIRATFKGFRMTLPA